jgi:hypothetical protein
LVTCPGPFQSSAQHTATCMLLDTCSWTLQLQGGDCSRQLMVPQLS